MPILGTGLGAAPTGYGSQYDQLFAQNPYRNLTYRKSGWQNFLGSLGFRTDYDRWKEDAQVNSAEYDAGVFSQIQQNAYNDPSAQADRMRAAGMNPDLLGTGDVAGAASPTEDPNGMSPNIGNEEFNKFGEGVMRVLSTAIVTYKDFLSIGQMHNMIESGDIENAKGFLGTLDSIIEGAFTSDDMQSQVTFADAVNRLSSSLSDDESFKWEDSIPYRYGFSKRQRKQFYDVARTRLNSMLTDKNAWSRFKERNESLSGAYRSLSDPFYSASEEQDVGITIFASNLAKLARDKMSLDSQAAKSASAVEKEYQDEALEQHLGKAKAGAEGAQFDADWYMAQLHSTIGRTQKAILDELEEKANQGNQFCKHLLINWSLNNMVNVNLGASLSLGANFGLSDVTSHILKLAQ